MRKVSKLVIILSIVMILICVYIIIDRQYIYMKNEGKLNLINKYLNYYDVCIPASAKVEDLKFKPYSYPNTKTMIAILSIKNNDIDSTFDKELRRDSFPNMQIYSEDDEFWFSIHLIDSVVESKLKLFYASQNLVISVMQPKDEYTRVYISLDHIGWIYLN